MTEFRGRPKGIPRDGTYGRGIKTEVMRVPEGSRERVQTYLHDFDEFIREWKSKSKDTRDWTQAKKLLDELESLFGGEV